MKRPHSLIVGGTRGTGRVLGDLLAERGHAVSRLGRKPPEGTSDGSREAAVGKTADASAIRTWLGDLTDGGVLRDTLSRVLSEQGKLNYLFFFQRFRGEVDDWDGEIETGLTLTRNVIDYLAPSFDPDGTTNGIVLIGSVAGHVVVHGQALGYHVVKAGLRQMAAYYAVRLGPGIRVNCVSPGAVMKESAKPYYESRKSLLETYRKNIPLGRMGTSREIAEAAALLCNPGAAYITGQELIVDGGLSLLSQESLQRAFAAEEEASKPNED